MKNTRTKVWWWKLLTAIFVIAIIIITTITLVAYGFLIGFSGTPYVYYEDQIFETKIKERNVSNELIDNNGSSNYAFNNGAPSYLLGEKGIALFKEKITNRLGFGPEFFALKEIIFTEGGTNDLIQSASSALYFPSTQQIILNTSTWIEYFKSVWDQREEYYDDITEFLFQSFYHEYGHHLANVYLVNMDPSDSWASSDIYVDGNNGRIIEPWNKTFLSDFNNYLYPSNQTKYTSQNIVNSFSGAEIKASLTYNNQTKDNLVIKSIGSLYTSQDLFNISNGQPSPQFVDVVNGFNNNIGYSFSPFKTNFSTPILFKNFSLDSLIYIFTMQELFTRKYMQLTFPFQTTKLISSEGVYTSSLNAPKVFNGTTYLTDTLNYQMDFNSTNNLRYLQDAPLKDDSTANGLIQTFFDHIGKTSSWINGKSDNSGANISFIWNNNTSKYYADSFGIHAQRANLNQSNLLKFGGFLTDQQAAIYQYVGYYDETNKFNPVKIDVFNSGGSSPYNFGYKYNRITNLAQARAQGTESAFYVVNNDANNGWINPKDILNKQLYFSNDKTGTKAEPLISTLNQDLSPAWTKRFYKPLGIENAIINYQVNSVDAVSISMKI